MVSKGPPPTVLSLWAVSPGGSGGDLYGVTSQGGLARGDDEGNGIVFESEP